MSTNPNDGSVQAVAQMLFEQPAAEDNPSEVVEAEAPTTDDDQIDVEEYIAESEDAEDDDLELIDHFDDGEEIDEDELTAETPAVPQELSDDFALDVKSDGQMKKVTLKELKQSFAGQDYIQKGMAENAELRKQLDAQIQAQSERNERLDQIIQQYESGQFMQAPARPSQELAQSDPLAYAIQLGEYRDQMNEYEAHKAELERAKDQQLEQRNAELERYKNQQAEQLRQEMPELNDPVKGQKLLADISSTATGHYGVPAEVLQNLVHGWEFKILRDAVAYQKLKQKRDAVAEKTKDARPMKSVKPGAKRTDDPKRKKAERASRAMRKNGDAKSVTSWLLSG